MIWEAVQDEDVDNLIKAGLTSGQAKVYLALVLLQKATISEISKKAKVDRADTYRLVTELEEIGLVERIIAKPNFLVAVPIKDGLSTLLDNKKKEYTEMSNAVSELQQKFKAIVDKNRDGKISQYILIPQGNQIIRRLREIVEKCQKNICCTVTWKEFSKNNALHLVLALDIERAMKRGIKFQFLVNENSKSSWPKSTKRLAKNPNFEIRTLSAVPFMFAMCDSSEIYIPQTQGGLQEYPALWSNNPIIAGLAKSYFDKLWNEGTPADLRSKTGSK